MITPVIINGLVLFVSTLHASQNTAFVCWSTDNAYYCRIDYGTI